MKIVFAKHSNSEKEFMFEVPLSVEIKKGDALAVDTIYGQALATATTDSNECSKEAAERLGAYFPLKKVLFVITNDVFKIVAEALVNNKIKGCDYPTGGKEYKIVEVESGKTPF